MKKIVVFGLGSTSSVISYYIKKWKLFSIAAYTVDTNYPEMAIHENTPVIPLDEVALQYPPIEYDAFVAIGYHQLNRLRAEKINILKGKGYRMVSVINPNAPQDCYLTHGENCFIMPSDDFLTPWITLKNNVFVWHKVSIGHSVTINDNCWIASGSMLGGEVTIGKNTFLGMQCCVKHTVSIGKNCIINTGAIIEHDTKIGNNCHISTSSVVNGTCYIGDGTFIGSNSVISHNIEITENIIIGAGSVVIKSINESGVYCGNPAKRIK